MTARPDMLLWLDDHRGIYIPQAFAESFKERDKHVTGVTPEEWAALEHGPDDLCYWDVWADVIDRAVVTDDKGVKFRLWQDGDLWLVPEGMEWNDEDGCFAWPQEGTDDD